MLIDFTYIIGGNIELFVEAEITFGDSETNSADEVIINHVMLRDGLEVEIDDIRIAGSLQTPNGPIVVTQSLDDLLQEQALEAYHKNN